MPLELLDHKLYREKEVIDQINKDLGVGTLNKQMLIYLRDIRGLCPKPIRIKTGSTPGGAHSFYTEETIKSLKKIMLAYDKSSKTLNEAVESFRPAIERINAITEILKPQFEKFAKIQKQFAEMGEVIAKDWERNKGKIIREALKEQIQETLQSFEGNANESTVDAQLEELFCIYKRWQDYRIQERALKDAQKGSA